MSSHRSIVWLNDEEAHIFRLDAELFNELTIRAAAQPQGVSQVGNEARLSFFQAIARALDPADEILIAGPSGTQHAFAQYMHKDEHSRDPRIRGVETVSQPTGDVLSSFAKLYFGKGPGQSNGNGWD